MGGFFISNERRASMVDRSYILNSALRASTRKNNVVALAFLQALGWQIGAPIGSVEDAPEWDDPEVLACFANHGSPMDGRF